MIQAFIQPLLSFCLPPSCAICMRPDDRAVPLCPDCEGRLADLEAKPSCYACGKPLAPGSACGWCIGKGIPHFNRIIRLGTYDEPLRELIIQMKYKNRWPFAEYLADRLLKLDQVKAVLTSVDCIVPVPLHWRRQLSRGYNQANVLAQRLRRSSRLPVVRSAVRVRHTPTQTKMLSTEARKENMRNAFGLVKPESIRGRRVLVVDDVMTSGATLQHLARTLMKAEPKSLDAIVLAVGDPKRAGFTVS